jgi:cystinosin
MNFDFIAMNLTGFTFYSIYNSYGYFISEDQTGKVDLNDLLFSYHAIIATLLTLSQIMIFPKQSNKIHTPTIIYLVVMWTFLAVWTLLTDVPILLSQGLKIIDVSVDARSVSLMGYCKLSISFLKYLPQFYWNYKRKSTVGWSIINIILDFTGGFFSFLQMGL